MSLKDEINLSVMRELGSHIASATITVIEVSLLLIIIVVVVVAIILCNNINKTII